MKLNVKNLLTGPPNRLRYTFRYSTCRIAHPESVAEHSYYVTLYCLAIADWLNIDRYARRQNGDVRSWIGIDLGTLLKKAVLHDLEECVSGDFPRTFKYSDPQTKSTLDAMAKLAFGQVVCGIFPNAENGGLATSIDWRNHWENSKDETVEGRIVRVADFLCVLGFMNDESDAIRLQHVDTLERYYRLFQKPEFDFLRQILDQAGELLDVIKGRPSSADENERIPVRGGPPPSDSGREGEAVRQPAPQHADARVPNHGSD